MAARYGLTDEEVADGLCADLPVGAGRRWRRGGLRRLTSLIAPFMLTETHAKAQESAKRAGLADLAARPERFAAALIAHGQRRPAARQDRRRRRRVPRRRGPHADPQGDEGGRAAPARDAGDQGLSRQRRRQALRRAAAADPARRACRRRAHRRRADARRLRRASAGVRADRDRQSRCAGVRRHPDLAQPCADHRRRSARDRRISLLRARTGRDPLRRHDRQPWQGAAGRRRLAPRLLPQSDRRRSRRRAMGRGHATWSPSAG